MAKQTKNNGLRESIMNKPKILQYDIDVLKDKLLSIRGVKSAYVEPFMYEDASKGLCKVFVMVNYCICAAESAYYDKRYHIFSTLATEDDIVEYMKSKLKEALNYKLNKCKRWVIDIEEIQND